MNSEDKKFWTVFRNTASNKISKEEYQRISKMHAFYKKHAYYLPCTCNPKGIQRFIDDLNEIYDKI